MLPNAPRAVLGRYLERLGRPIAGPPSIGNLCALQRAHLERIPYETIDIHLGRSTSISPPRVAARIGSGSRGGYCFHLNGAFGWLLAGLGYRVSGHRASVQERDRAETAPLRGNHLALVVHALPGPGHPGGSWLVDVGLGTGPHEPLPLAAGEYRQGAFAYRVEPSPLERGGWRMHHDSAGESTTVDVAPGVARSADLRARHRYLSAHPHSPYQRVLTAQRRAARRIDLLRGCVLLGCDGGQGCEQLLETRREWFAALGEVFGITLDDLAGAERDALWRRVHDAHQRWLATRVANRVSTP